jgi:hypothetical protein
MFLTFAIFGSKSDKIEKQTIYHSLDINSTYHCSEVVIFMIKLSEFIVSFFFSINFAFFLLFNCKNENNLLLKNNLFKIVSNF